MPEVMKTEPAGLLPRRLPAILAFSLLLLTWPVSLLAGTCDCSCSRYGQLLTTLTEGANEPDTLVERCGGACAIAWTQCEARYARDDNWTPLAEQSDSETDESESSDNDRPLVSSGDNGESIYLR